MASPSSRGSGAGDTKGPGQPPASLEGPGFQIPFLPHPFFFRASEWSETKPFPETLPRLKGSWALVSGASPLSPEAWTASH